MRITLTEKQIRQLVPYFDRVQATAALGRPGMLVAQLRWNKHEAKYWMEPAFLPHENAKCIEEKGQHCPAPPPTELADSTAPHSGRSALDAPAAVRESVPQAHQSQDSCA